MGCTNNALAISAKNVAITNKGSVQSMGGGEERQLGGDIPLPIPSPPPPPPLYQSLGVILYRPHYNRTHYSEHLSIMKHQRLAK